jgi:CRP/FNR family transcriptional regulator, cyclic AMP receptor protein
VNTEDLPLFADLTGPERAALDACLRIRTFPAQVMIVHEGDPSHSLYLILEGRVKVFTGTEDGREALLCTQAAGEYFGEMGLLDGAPRSASVITLERTRLAIIPASG